MFSWDKGNEKVERWEDGKKYFFYILKKCFYLLFGLLDYINLCFEVLKIVFFH